MGDSPSDVEIESMMIQNSPFSMAQKDVKKKHKRPKNFQNLDSQVLAVNPLVNFAKSLARQKSLVLSAGS